MTRMISAPVVALVLVGCAVDGDSVDTRSLSGSGPALSLGDRIPPQITLKSGVRGAWAEAGPFTISGTVRDRGTGVSVMMIDGEPVTVGEDGTFSLVVEGQEGLNSSALLVVDHSGNVASMTVSWLAGRFAPSEVMEVNAVEHRMSAVVIQDAAFAAAETLSSALVPLQVGEALQAFDGCMVLDGVVEAIQFGEPAVVLAATSDGLQAEVRFSALTVQTRGVADACGIETPFAASLTHASPVFTARLGLGVQGEALVASIEESSFSLDGAVVSIPELQEDLDAHGLSGEDVGLIEAIEAAFDAELREVLPTQVLQALEAHLPAPVDFGALPGIQTEVVLAGVRSGAGFLQTNYTAVFQLTEGREEAQAPGWLVMASDEPITELRADLHVDVSLDALNRALYAAWAGGRLRTEQPFPRSLVGEKTEFLTFSPALPPVIQSRDGGLWLDLGEVALEYRVGEERTLRGTYRATLSIPINTQGEPIAEASLTLDVVGGRAMPSGAEDVLQQILDTTIYPTIPRVPTVEQLHGEDVSVVVGDLTVVSGWVESMGMFTP